MAAMIPMGCSFTSVMGTGCSFTSVTGTPSLGPLLIPSRHHLASSGGFSPQRKTAVVVLRAAASSSKPGDVAAAGKREPRGITKPKPVSPAMQALVGVPEIPRTQALKLIWAHIKKHNLQDPENKKIIVCDEKLKNIFGGRERVGFLEISGLLNPHFGK